MLIDFFIKRVIKTYVNELLKQINNIDIKTKIKNYIDLNKDKITLKVKKVIYSEIQKITDNVIKKFSNKNYSK